MTRKIARPLLATPTPVRVPPVAQLRLVNKARAAEILSCSIQTVGRLIASRSLPCHRIGRMVRVAEIDVQAFIRRSVE